MNLLNMTFRNVQRNFRVYTIYLFAMITGVMVHFTFSSLMYNEDILDVLNNKESFQTGVSIASVVIFLFIIFFILYANSFFMKQRKKEFGLYLLLGMKESQITRMVFVENLLIGSFSLVIGILLGGLLSKFFGMALMNLMQYDNVITLNFPYQAIGSTIILFLLLAIIASIQSFFMISRVQLVELFHAKEKMEKPIPSSFIMAALSLILLATEFFLISRGKESSIWQDHLTFAMIAVTVGMIGGTYLFFRQFSGWLLQKIRQKHNFHEGNRVLWISSLRFQIRSNTLNLTFISLFSATIIFLIGFVSINYAVQFEAVGRNLPNDIAFQSLDKETNEKIDAKIKNSDHSIEYHKTLEALVGKPNTNMNLAFENPEYFSKDVFLFPEKAYNEIISLRGNQEEIHLEDMEAVTLSQGTDFPKSFPSDQLPRFKVNVNEDITLKLIEKKDYALLGWASDPVRSMILKPAVLIISDEAYQNLKSKAKTVHFEIYEIENEKQAESLSADIHAIVTKKPDTYYSSFADVYSKQIEGSALMLFAAAFLAVIALFALASVIYFKQLREATEEQRQYSILRKIGTADRELKSVIRKQLLFVFFPPLVLGILHSWLILKYYILDSVQDFPQLTSMLWFIFAIYFVIYVMFYLSSANLYYKIVNQKY
ncbi:FtsX-like permease family protein [Peribacillus frigoritolerans]|uniref:FtsX-like permease family protein n=1 Tax=Peribacillus frigoritolerans TaxID=450367 RepID=UPI00207A846B|nr:ABC transporter permease [Peribacillus frigoritolerans]USK75937.1 ABC transporter permease [Peribacillus frigoritolerans]